MLGAKLPLMAARGAGRSPAGASGARTPGRAVRDLGARRARDRERDRRRRLPRRAGCRRSSGDRLQRRSGCPAAGLRDGGCRRAGQLGAAPTRCACRPRCVRPGQPPSVRTLERLGFTRTTEQEGKVHWRLDHPGRTRRLAGAGKEPADRCRRNRGRGLVASPEPPVCDLIARPSEQANDGVAGLPDRQDVVERAVRDEDTRDAEPARATTPPGESAMIAGKRSPFETPSVSA